MREPDIVRFAEDLVASAGPGGIALTRADRILRYDTSETGNGREVDLTGGVRASTGDIVITRHNDRTWRWSPDALRCPGEAGAKLVEVFSETAGR